MDEITNPINKSSKLCVHLTRYNNCKHGISGKNCAFTHPKVCSKWKNFGGGKGGCKKGKDCKFFHLPLCNSAKRGTECNKRETCRYIHPKNAHPKTTYQTVSPRNDTLDNCRRPFLGMRQDQIQVWNQRPTLGLRPDQNQVWNQRPNNQMMNSDQNQIMLNLDLIGILRLLSQNMSTSQQGMVPVRVNY